MDPIQILVSILVGILISIVPRLVISIWNRWLTRESTEHSHKTLPSSDPRRSSEYGSDTSSAIELGSVQAQPPPSGSDALQLEACDDGFMNAPESSPSPHDPRSDLRRSSDSGSHPSSAIHLGSERAVTQPLTSEPEILLKTCDDVLEAPESPSSPRNGVSALRCPSEDGSHLSFPIELGLEHAVTHPLPSESGGVSEPCDDVLQSSDFPLPADASSIWRENHINKIISAVTGYAKLSP
jgi:hypothetical protein